MHKGFHYALFIGAFAISCDTKPGVTDIGIGDMAEAAPPRVLNVGPGVAFDPQVGNPVDSNRYGLYVRFGDKHLLYSQAGTISDLMAGGLSCPTCSGNLGSFIYGSAAGVLSPTQWFWDATNNRACTGNSNPTTSYCFQLPVQDGAKRITLGYRAHLSAGNWIEIASTDGSGVVAWYNNTQVLSVTDHVKLVTSGLEFSDGTVQNSAAVGPPLFQSSLVNIIVSGAHGASDSAGDFTLGNEVTVNSTGNILGVYLYFANINSYTLSCRLYNPANVLVASGSINVTGPGPYACSFTTPYTVTSSDLYKHFKTGVYNPGGHYTYVAPSSLGDTPFIGDTPFLNGPYFTFIHTNIFSDGSAVPLSSSAGERYPMTPIFVRQ